MATAEEIIKMMSENPEVYANQLSEEEYCTLDEQNRKIIVPSIYEIVGVESDEKVERIKFKFPRIVGDNIDLSKLSIRVNYQNANQEIDRYYSSINNFDSEYVYFDWVLSRKVTKYEGEISYIVCAVKTNTDGTITNEWNTTISKSMVLEGLEPEFTEEEEEQVRDLLLQSLSIIETEKNNSLSEISATKDASIKQIQQYGNGVIYSIPEDYTSLDTLVKEIDRTRSNGISETAKGETIEISGSEDKLFRNIKLLGKGTQESVAYNCIDISQFGFNGEVDYSDNTLKIYKLSQEDYEIFGNEAPLGNSSWTISKIAPKLVANKTYTIFGDSDGVETCLYVYTSTIGDVKWDFGTSLKITQDMIDNGIFEVFRDVGDGYITLSNIMIVEGTQEKPYQPFVSGETITPSPENPLPIKGVGNYNEDLQKYEVPINVTGNQLFDASKMPTKTQDNVTVTNNSDGGFTVSGNGVIQSGVSFVYDYSSEDFLKLFRPGLLYNKSNQDINPYFIPVIISNQLGVVASISPNKSFDISQYLVEGYRMRVQFYSPSGQSIKPGTTKPMLYQSGDGTWEPFKTPQQAIISFDEPLYGIPVESGGNYVDMEEQQWVSDVVDLQAKTLTRYCGVKVFDGSGDEFYQYSGNCVFMSLSGYQSYGLFGGLCDKFNFSTWENVSGGLVDNSFTVYRSKEWSELRIGFYKSNIGNDIQAWKTWLQSNPITVVYPLATPTTTPLTPDQISALQALQSYYPNTNVFTNTNPQAGLEVEYNADIKMYVDSVVSKAVTQAITIAQGGNL